MTSGPLDVDASQLLSRAADGDEDALRELFSRHRGRLKRMVRLRMNRRLQGRIDDSDVLQEAYLEASKRLADYVREPSLPVSLWLRHITGQKLIDAHRRHLGAEKRDAGRDVTLHRGAFPAASSASLAAHLLGKLTSPSQAAVKAELRVQLQDALNNMDALDREVLTLRHFEQLSNSDAAKVLGIDVSAASNRYVRAVRRLRTILTNTPGFLPQ